jgi:hypothetical protein
VLDGGGGAAVEVAAGVREHPQRDAGGDRALTLDQTLDVPFSGLADLPDDPAGLLDVPPRQAPRKVTARAPERVVEGPAGSRFDDPGHPGRDGDPHARRFGGIVIRQRA